MNIVFGVGKQGVTSIPAEWAGKLRERGHDVRVIASSDGRFTFPARLRRKISASDADVVHLHHTVPVLSAAVLPRRDHRRYATVVTIHRSMDAMNAASGLAHRVAGRTIDAVVANSDATRASIPDGLFATSRIETIYNGVDLSLLDSARPTDRNSRDGVLRLVSVGRLIPEKGFDILLSAVARLREQPHTPPFCLQIIGSGPEFRSLKGMIGELRLGDTVVLSGQQPRETVYSTLWGADVFIMASRTEGFCNAVAEAMAAAVPVVATPAGALPEVLDDTGWIAADLTPEGLAAAISTALTQDPALLRERAGRAARRARSMFTVEHTIDQYEALYASLLVESR